MITWTLNVMTGDTGKAMGVRSFTFETKRELLAAVRNLGKLSSIRKVGPQQYTAVPRRGGK